MAARGRDRAPSVDRIRADIDAGRAGDRRPFPDIAAAPLGTDDEAAGFPPSAEERCMTHAAEIAGRSDDTQPSVAAHVPYSPGSRPRGGVAPSILTGIYWVAALAGVVVLIALLAILR